MRTPLLLAAASLALFTVAGSAGASSNFVTAIPNGTCSACHTAPPTTNLFGDEVAKIKGTPMSTWWPGLYGLDSDNDGQTNGQELGDPCGTWKMGDPKAPRTTDISNPGDNGSKSLSPHVPSCGSGSSSGGGGAGSGSGPSSGAGPAGSGSGAGSGGAPAKSTGAGQGETPPTVQTGACASIAPIAPTESGGAVAAAWLALAVVALKRRRR